MAHSLRVIPGIVDARVVESFYWGEKMGPFVGRGCDRLLDVL